MTDPGETPSSPETPVPPGTPTAPASPGTPTAPDGSGTPTAPDGSGTPTAPDGSGTPTAPGGPAPHSSPAPDASPERPADPAPSGSPALPGADEPEHALLDYEQVQDSPEFQALRRRFRRFVFPMTAFFLVWYLTYVLLADYAHGFMSTQVWGTINVGLLLGLGQFVTTFAITMIYAHWANKKQDPMADELRQRIEGRDLV